MNVTYVAQHVQHYELLHHWARKARARLFKCAELNRAGAQNNLGRWGWKRCKVVKGVLHLMCVPGCWHRSTGSTGPQESQPLALQSAPYSRLSPGRGSAYLLLRLSRPQLHKQAGPSHQLMWRRPWLVSSNAAQRDGRTSYKWDCSSCCPLLVAVCKRQRCHILENHHIPGRQRLCPGEAERIYGWNTGWCMCGLTNSKLSV